GVSLLGRSAPVPRIPGAHLRRRAEPGRPDGVAPAHGIPRPRVPPSLGASLRRTPDPCRGDRRRRAGARERQGGRVMSVAPGAKVNRIGLTPPDYQPSKSTLFPACGHDANTNSIIQAAYEAGLEQHRVAKLSGIGCSSKTPAYFLGRSHAFNAVHGRMPSIATGVHLANRELILLGVSGDGDSASIGLG